MKTGPQSRSYGIWGSFLHSPALEELRINIFVCNSRSKHINNGWDLSTFCAKTVRNIVAALPRHIDLIGIGEPYTYDETDPNGETRIFATAEEVQELFGYFEDIRGVDADVWRTEMECTSQPPASPRSGRDVQEAGTGWAVV